MSTLAKLRNSAGSDPLGQTVLRLVVWQVAVVLLFGITQIHADPEPAKSAESDEAKAARPERLEAMRVRVASLAVTVESPEKEPTSVELVQAPLLNYTDLAGNTTDGTIWAWGKTGRPVALTGVFFDYPRSGFERWSCELLSLSDGPVTVRGKPGWEWKPVKSDLEWNRLTGTPVPAETPVVRLRQMKEIARRFTATETLGPTRTDQLRLMDRPLHRYADPERGLIDGALYSFAAGTNPEVLLLLESRADAETGSTWYCALARMTAAECEARLDEKVYWRRDPNARWESRKPYYSVFGANAIVFGVGDSPSRKRD